MFQVIIEVSLAPLSLFTSAQTNRIKSHNQFGFYSIKKVL